MKPRSREINIFNLSMLDVIAGALGAVLIIMIVLIPDYGMKRTEDEFQSAQQQVRRLQEENQKLEAEARRLRIRNPLVVSAAWRTSGDDVDLFVQDSFGAPEFRANQKNPRGYRQGMAATELAHGPGQETIMIRDVPAGEWNIYLNLWQRRGATERCRIHVYVLYDGAFIDLPRVFLSNVRQGYRLGTLVVDADLNMTFRGASPAIQREWERMRSKR